MAQGALGIECRAGDSFLIELLGKLDHKETALAVRAERQYLGRLNGGCQIPIGAYAEVRAGEGSAADGKLQLEMTVMVAAPDGSRIRLRGGAYVLALGGLETTRLLLASNDVRPAGIGNDSDHLGRQGVEAFAADTLVPLLRLSDDVTSGAGQASE